MTSFRGFLILMGVLLLMGVAGLELGLYMQSFFENELLKLVVLVGGLCIASKGFDDLWVPYMMRLKVEINKPKDKDVNWGTVLQAGALAVWSPVQGAYAIMVRPVLQLFR